MPSRPTYETANPRPANQAAAEEVSIRRSAYRMCDITAWPADAETQGPSGFSTTKPRFIA